ncbi:Type I restriction-modification enzyme subunit M [Xenorhabdus bovienii str. Jollieti]|uniref:site-specific DNA-methyltransferase (adenine-specific) n=1 Tax=Xenorhabdus bovienii (strain SS-2004) TaxID=406818 RepID=D3UXZ4_XENBS|nr:type I restriction-modification system subunit M [Xenorhabdus bovienii]MDE9486562.1 type I restriction-modification system subunit M [Xenorhabdus bovienii]CBJ79172.1 Type I restriction-modification enzyme subunit M [Xenorhabdus bovienii SS-2004]CDH29209.1 Type I restriction-modification enzyme subunit M [Xenorhabdus bovienii str. Jollieti]
MAIKKNELYSSLWASCDELRGGMDASQYKDYVLTMLFMKYVSDKYKNDRYGIIVIPEGAGFDDMVALKGKKDIGDEINKIIRKLADENGLGTMFDVANFNDEEKLGKGKEMIDRLSKLVGIFEGLDLSNNYAGGDDLMGDAYEYLMRHFATESGKSKGQFYTPAEVSLVLAKIIGINDKTPRDASVYDPTCGSGSLLLKASDEAPRGLSIFGQEMDVTTSSLAKMNMILHGHESDVHSIQQGNTIASPVFKDDKGQLKTFDFAVANPPFSNKNWTSGINPREDEFGRFGWGIPPEKNGDYAFLLHILKSLKSTGKGAVILPHGVLFRGNAESLIRENLIKQGYIRGIIGLPANLFYGTGIPACIIVLDKQDAISADFDAEGKVTRGRDIFMIDASRDFIKDGNKNRLRSQDIYKIVEVFTQQKTLPRFSRTVEFKEIVANDYNLNIPRYIDSSEPEDLHDLSAHLQGGIPNRDIDVLDKYWNVFPGIRSTLFATEREGYSHSLVEANQVKDTILNHTEFKTFAEQSLKPFAAWCQSAALKEIHRSDNPKELLNDISGYLLINYESVPLLSKYDVYQILMDYWAETMQDDVYVLVQDDWAAGKKVRELVVKQAEKLKETPDFVIKKTKYKAEIIPPALIIQNYFAGQQVKIDQLQIDADNATQALENYIEENSGDDGLLNDALNDKDKVTKASITARLKLATDNEEKTVLKQAKELFDAEIDAKKELKKYQEALDLSVLKQYSKLTDDEIKTLVVDKKWLATLEANIQAEIERVTQQLTNRVRELEERYAESLPTISKSVDSLSSKVADNLKAMGLEWVL